jgi:hypothetical protein
MCLVTVSVMSALPCFVEIILESVIMIVIGHNIFICFKFKFYVSKPHALGQTSPCKPHVCVCVCVCVTELLSLEYGAFVVTKD